MTEPQEVHCYVCTICRLWVESYDRLPVRADDIDERVVCPYCTGLLLQKPRDSRDEPRREVNYLGWLPNSYEKHLQREMQAEIYASSYDDLPSVGEYVDVYGRFVTRKGFTVFYFANEGVTGMVFPGEGDWESFNQLNDILQPSAPRYGRGDLVIKDLEVRGSATEKRLIWRAAKSHVHNYRELGEIRLPKDWFQTTSKEVKQ